MTGTTFWTSGLHDPTTNVWRWSYNHFPLPPFPPWGAGFPSNPPNTSLRVQIYHTSRYDAMWRTVSDTQSHRYICEVNQSSSRFYLLKDEIFILDPLVTLLKLENEREKHWNSERVTLESDSCNKVE